MIDRRILANAFNLLRNAKHTVDGPGAYALVEVLAAMERELQPPTPTANFASQESSAPLAEPAT